MCGPLATLLRGLDAVSPPARKELIAAYSQGPLTVKLDDGSAPGSVDPASRALLSRIVRDLPPGIRIVAIRSDQPSSVAVRAILRDGQAVTVNVLLDDGPFPPPPPFSPSGPPPPGPPPSHGPGYGPPMGPPNMPPPEPSFLSLPVLLPLIFLIASTILLSIWAARRLAAPLARFAAAVDRFSGAGIESPVREEGRAISNLIENATKFGATVTARLTTSPESITIDVEDDGPGISDEEKQRVMEPFYRTDPARQVTGGFGLGLAIVLAIAETHGGTLTLLDRQPRGLCARISFPAATSADLRAT